MSSSFFVVVIVILILIVIVIVIVIVVVVGLFEVEQKVCRPVVRWSFGSEVCESVGRDLERRASGRPHVTRQDGTKARAAQPLRIRQNVRDHLNNHMHYMHYIPEYCLQPARNSHR